MKTSTTTDIGATLRTTAPFGHPRPSQWDGHRTALAIGFGSPRGVGRGWMMSLGGSLPSTTAAGLTSKTDGAGFPVQSLCGRFTLPPWWYLSGTATVFASGVDRVWPGFRWRLAKSTCQVIEPAGRM